MYRITFRIDTISILSSERSEPREHNELQRGEGGPLEAPPEAEDFVQFRFISHHNCLQIAPRDELRTATVLASEAWNNGIWKSFQEAKLYHLNMFRVRFQTFKLSPQSVVVAC